MEPSSALDRHIYFMGVGGTAMGAVAILLEKMGYQVSGSDLNLYPPMSEELMHAGIKVFHGYDAERLAKLDPDLIVVGNVIGRGNVEAEWLLEHRRIPFVSLPQLIGEFLIGKRCSIVVSGTHGKTTTTAMITHLLRAANVDPGYLIAGVMRDQTPSTAIGNEGSPFVIEGDEYDSAFFDKRSKFIHYLPRILTINNLEFDHGDVFRDDEDIRRSFSHLLRLVPQSGHILVQGDDPKLVKWVQREAIPKVWRIGFGEDNDLQIRDFEEKAEGSSFSLYLLGSAWMRINWELGAEYNARNGATALLAAALHLNPSAPERFKSSYLSTFSGVKRRQQVLLKHSEIMVVEDFAHHPTAVEHTLCSFKKRFPEHMIWCAFEPRSNTSRSAAFQERWPQSLGTADAVWIGAIHRIHMLDPKQTLNTTLLCQHLVAKGVTASSFTDNHALLAHLLNQLNQTQQPVVVVFCSNGSFDGISRACCEALSGHLSSPQDERENRYTW